MITKKGSSLLILLAVTPLLFMGCKHAQPAEEPIFDTVVVEPELEIEEEEPEIIEETPAPAPAVVRPAVKKEPVKDEVLYISGHGANGRVWGHITMKGNKGTGTVTDEHENALTVSCTRQGEELICYDQNSRQYIFRL
ncbi:MAG: hypothetical protein MJZ86_03155 [Bacteroidales bacterium]|nr:hypothetical protein [Bacteroidales bacterium]